MIGRLSRYGRKQNCRVGPPFRGVSGEQCGNSVYAHKALPYLLCVLTWFFGAKSLHTQTYFSRAYDIDLCYNEGRIIGQISDETVLVSGIMQCNTPYFFRGYTAFEFDLFDGTLTGYHTNERFNIWNNRSGLIKDGFLIGGTASFVPEKGLWKVDAAGNVLDSVLFNHPDEFNFSQGLAEYDGGYVISIIDEFYSKADMMQVDSNLEIVAYYPEYIDFEPYDTPRNHFEGPDGELYFSVCRGEFGGTCDSLPIYRFEPDGNHELIFDVGDEASVLSPWNGIALPADDSSFYYLWTRDTAFYDEVMQQDFAIPGIVSKVTYDGERLWDAYFWDFNAYVTEAFTTQNGDIVILGEVANHFDYQEGTIPPELLNGGYAARVTPSGEILWERKILDATRCVTGNDQNKFCYSTFYNGTELPNGDLLFTGRIDSVFGTNSNTWVVKTDPNGCLIPDCGLVQVLDTTFYTSTQEWSPRRVENVPLRISPNPVGGSANVSIALPAGETTGLSGQLRVVNSLGQVIETASGVSLPYQQSTWNWPLGQYTIQWLNAGKVWVGRLVVTE